MHSKYTKIYYKNIFGFNQEILNKLNAIEKPMQVLPL